MKNPCLETILNGLVVNFICYIYIYITNFVIVYPAGGDEGLKKEYLEARALKCLYVRLMNTP